MEEIMKTHRNLPNRPRIEEVKAAKTLIQKVEAEAQSKLDAISRKKMSINMPDDVFIVLQEMRRKIVHFESKEQKREAVRLLDLENAHQVSAELIQRASKCVGSDTRLEVMAMKGFDGEKVSLPFWFWGIVPEENDSVSIWIRALKPEVYTKIQLYCVDIMEEDVYSQKKFRVSLHSRDECGDIERRHTDGDSDVIKLDSPKGAFGLRLHADSIAKGISIASTFLAVGSSIYFVGGDNGSMLQNTIHYLDTNALHLGWRIHRMKVGRRYPNVAAVGGKFYIVGGAAGPKGSILGEFFDPHSGQSELMPDAPSEYVDFLSLITVLPESEEILFHSYKPVHLLYYGVNSGKWRIDLNDDKENEVNLLQMKDNFSRSVNVVLGKIIYWFSYSYTLTAYDFSTRKFYELKCSLEMDFEEHGFPDHNGFMRPVALFHLSEDYFCLLWNDALRDNWFPDEPDTYYKQLRCTKLQICIDQDSKYLTASLLSTQTYLLEPHVAIMGALAMPSSNAE